MQIRIFTTKDGNFNHSVGFKENLLNLKECVFMYYEHGANEFVNILKVFATKSYFRANLELIFGNYVNLFAELHLSDGHVKKIEISHQNIIEINDADLDKIIRAVSLTEYEEDYPLKCTISNNIEDLQNLEIFLKRIQIEYRKNKNFITDKTPVLYIEITK